MKKLTTDQSNSEIQKQPDSIQYFGVPHIQRIDLIRTTRIFFKFTLYLERLYKWQRNCEQLGYLSVWMINQYGVKAEDEVWSQS